MNKAEIIEYINTIPPYAEESANKMIAGGTLTEVDRHAYMAARLQQSLEMVSNRIALYLVDR